VATILCNHHLANFVHPKRRLLARPLKNAVWKVFVWEVNVRASRAFMLLARPCVCRNHKIMWLCVDFTRVGNTHRHAIIIWLGCWTCTSPLKQVWNKRPFTRLAYTLFNTADPLQHHYVQCNIVDFETSLVLTLPFILNIAHSILACSPAMWVLLTHSILMWVMMWHWSWVLHEHDHWSVSSCTLFNTAGTKA
jgi:hypothetical protein